jgi:hypothetical protein
VSIFSRKEKTVKTISPLRPCWCGYSGYSSVRADDAVKCNNCGALYMVTGSELNPVARFVWDVPHEIAKR